MTLRIGASYGKTYTTAWAVLQAEMEAEIARQNGRRA